ncbi:MAG TPA: 5-dehydro-2-deoxygluconokinase, partial [Burkholderiaceae bacterium]
MSAFTLDDAGAAARRFDLACLGRLAVDLYAQQVGARLEDVSSFAKYLGGSSANIAFGAARLGLRAAMISRVGDEQMGRFLLESLQREGCDTSMVQVDPERLTALAILGLKDRDTFPLLFYRENCADMALDPAGIREEFIADCRALVVTGTHLSQPGVRAASERALEFAGRHRTLRVLDIDYRPVLWGLTRRGDGQTRYVPDAAVTASLQEMLPRFELLIGTEEEFVIAGGVPGDLLASLRRIREITRAAMVVKLGPLGCCLVDGPVPARLEDAPTCAGERVEVMNVLGAGDAFAAGLLTGLLRGQGFAEAARLANACGALVVSRHACAPAMPTPAELAHWFGTPSPDAASDARLAHLHRTTAARARRDELNVLAFDHRSQFYELAREAGAPESRLPALKALLVRAVERVERSRGLQGRVGVLVDEVYGAQALHAATGRGWWVGRPVELPGSRPLRFEGTASLGSRLVHWPREQVVKCLVHFHPDDAVDLRLEQEARLQEVWAATRDTGHELLLEVIPPRRPGHEDDVDDAVLRAVARLYTIGLKPEWWKLAPMRPQGWAALAALVAARDPQCRGAVILGLSQPLAELARGFADGTHPIVKGFMVGRSLWAEPARAWLRGPGDERGDDALVDAV